MSNPADVIQPPRATHVSFGYEGGEPTYYKRSERQHLNQVSEEWQALIDWYYWDFQLMTWVNVGPGFCNRRLKELK